MKSVATPITEARASATGTTPQLAAPVRSLGVRYSSSVTAVSLRWRSTPRMLAPSGCPRDGDDPQERPYNLRLYRRSGLAAASDLLEREGELALFGAHLRAAGKGAGGLVAIEGRAGMGKTRLVAEARASPDAAGFEVLAARGGELEEEFAYGVVRQLFEPLLATAGDDLRAEVLSGAAGLAAPLFDESRLAAALEGPTDTSFATLHGLYWLAANLALRRPTLLAIDDLHWADAPSLRWLAYLVRRLEGLQLLGVVALTPLAQSRNSELLTELVADPAAVLPPP